VILRADEREEKDRLCDEQARGAAETERLRGQVAALERALAEAGAAEQRTWDEERRQWQEQLDCARHQADQKCQAAQAEADALRQEVETVRQELEQALAKAAARDRLAEQAEAALQERDQGERLHGQLATLRHALAEAAAERVGLVRACQESRVEYEAKLHAAEDRARSDERRQWQVQLENARLQASQEAERSVREQKRAERLCHQVAAIEGALTEATAARDDLARAGREERARHEAEVRAADERARAEERRDWQGQLDDLRCRTGQELQAAHAEADHLRHEAESLRAECGEWKALRDEQAMASAEVERLRGQMSTLEGTLADMKAARDHIARAGQEVRAQHDSEARAWAEERSQLQGQFDDLRCRTGRDLQAANAESERFCLESQTLRHEREMLLHQVDALTQQLEHSTPGGNALVTSHQEGEQRFQTAVVRFGTLVEQIESLREEFQREQQTHKVRWSGAWTRLWTRPAPQPDPWEEAIFRRLDTLRNEATAQQRQALEASAETIRAGYEPCKALHNHESLGLHGSHG
jgi:chromosome segregation ATPase